MKKDIKTTAIAIINLIGMLVLSVLWYMDEITTEDLTIIITCITSALATVLGLFSADSKDTEE